MRRRTLRTAQGHQNTLFYLLACVVAIGLSGCGGALISTKEEREIGANVHVQIKNNKRST